MKILALIFCLFSAFFNAFAQTAPQQISLSGIKEIVTIRRDSRSIPYIEAKTDADLYFVQGYVTASDRLWQMDLLRRVARGEVAEIFGRLVLEEDKRWRRFGFAKVAKDTVHHLSPELRAALDNYARGVNAYMATLDEKTIPIEFRILQYKPREWRPEDTILIGKIMADALSSTWRGDLLRASLQSLPKEKFDDLTNQVTPYDVVLFGKDQIGQNHLRQRVGSSIVECGVQNAEYFALTSCGLRQMRSPVTTAVNLFQLSAQDESVRKSSLERIGFWAEDLAASNNWVISGKRTADGKPILANDPHLPPAAPGIWYLTHLSTPTMRVAGATFPGVPGIILGHNEHIAWGATNVGPDVQDLYIETFDANSKYKTPSGWETPIVRKEEIKVRTNPLKTDTEIVMLDVIETRNGPVILEDGGKKYALKWTARDPKNAEFEAFFFGNRARNWEDFKNALKNYGGPTQNFVYADIKGNIGWYAAGRIPIRRTGEGAFPYDGATNDGDWTGYIPFAEHPNLYNPAEGFIVTANQRIVGTSYKHPQMSRDAAPPWRARRLYDLLKENSKTTVDDVRDAQYDVFNIPLSNLAREIVKLEAASPETLSALRSWDGRMTPDSAGALLTNEIRICMANRMADENKPAPANLIRERVLDRAVQERSSRWLPKEFSNYKDFIAACDNATRTSLADPKRFGPDPSKWLWGSFTQARFTHPLSLVPLIGAQFAIPAVPIAGSGQTPNVASSVSMRHIATPGNWDATRHVIPLGQNGDPRSPHFKDQFEPWRTGKPQVFPFSKEAVEKAAVSLIEMRP